MEREREREEVMETAPANNAKVSHAERVVCPQECDKCLGPVAGEKLFENTVHAMKLDWRDDKCGNEHLCIVVHLCNVLAIIIGCPLCQFVEDVY